MATPKYPNITVRLIGTDGNAFSVMGKVANALKRAKVPQSEISEFQEQATSGDYNNLLRTCMEWVQVE